VSFLEALRVALLDLALHKVRSALAVLGIIFGVASVEAMVSISEGAKQDALRRISARGIDNIILRTKRPSETASKKPPKGGRYVAEFGLLRRDLAHVRRCFPMVRHAVGARDMRKSLYASSGRKLDLQVMATEPGYLDITRSEVLRGRFLCALDQLRHKRVCVLGVEAARQIFAWRDPMRQAVRIGSDWFRVVGIIENLAAVKAAGQEDLNRYVFIPLATAKARYGDVTHKRAAGKKESVRVQLDAIAIQMEHADAVIPTAQRAKAYLAKTHKQKDYGIEVPLELMIQKEATQRIFTIVMLSIASISLLVGGIGIMNIMLANVYERRKEIGTRRALGARRRDIIRQFVLESATLTFLGGAAGAVAGYGIVHLISRMSGWPTVFSSASVALGMGVSIAVGVFFGLWPAFQAARVNPIEALRSE
jgi:putative ABC transport system permease protein